MWLKLHNVLYRDIDIDDTTLAEYPGYDGDVDAGDTLSVGQVSGLDADVEDASGSSYVGAQAESGENDDNDIQFDTCGIFDNAGVELKTNECKAQALAHALSGGKVLCSPSGGDPVSEYDNPHLFAGMFPTLFPFGVGSNTTSRAGVSIESRVHLAMDYSDRRFQVHPSFMFVGFNISQRQKAAFNTKLVAQRVSFASLAERIQKMDPVVVSKLVGRMKLDQKHHTSVNLGTPGAKRRSRDEIWAVCYRRGTPCFYITTNPADTKNPIVLFLAGSAINLDEIFPASGKKSGQSHLIAKNPWIVAKFFDVVIRSF